MCTNAVKMDVKCNLKTYRWTTSKKNNKNNKEHKHWDQTCLISRPLPLPLACTFKVTQYCVVCLVYTSILTN